MVTLEMKGYLTIRIQSFKGDLDLINEMLITTFSFGGIKNKIMHYL